MSTAYDLPADRPTTITGWRRAMKRLIEGDTPEPMRSAALDEFSRQLRQPTEEWRGKERHAAQDLVADCQYAIDPDAELCDGLDELLASPHAHLFRW